MILLVPFPDKSGQVEVYFDNETRSEPELIGTIKDGVFFVDGNPLTANDLRKIARNIDFQNGEIRCGECGVVAIEMTRRPFLVVYHCLFNHDTVVMPRKGEV